MRSYRGRKQRAISRSTDGGLSWSEIEDDPNLIEPVCQASLIRYAWPGDGQPGVLLFANPASTTKRERMTIRASRDEGRTWPASRLIDPGFSGYCCLARLKNGDIGLIYERDNYQRLTFVSLPLSALTE